MEVHLTPEKEAQLDQLATRISVTGMVGRLCGVGLQHDFDAAVFFIAEGFVHFGGIFNLDGVGDDERGVDFARFDLAE